MSQPGSNNPLIPTRLIGRTCSLLRARGIGLDPLFSAFQLPKTVEQDPFVLLPADQIEQFLQTAADLANEPFLGIRVAEHTGYDVFNSLLFACSGARDGASALDRYVRYVGALHNDVRFSTVKVPAGTQLRIAFPGKPECLGRHWNEHLLVAFALASRNMADVRVVPVEARLAHSDARSKGELVRILGTTHVHFGGEFNALTFSKADLALPVRNRDAPVSSVLARYALSLPFAKAAESDLRNKVREVLHNVLADGEPTIGPIAKALGMSARTLQRRLSENAETFQQVLDELRRDLALPYVKRGDLSLEEIAARLGYSQASAFFRAFRRWTGRTPRTLQGTQEPRLPESTQPPSEPPGPADDTSD